MPTHSAALPGVRTGTPATFHDLMAQQLDRAPWLLLSVALHAVAFALLLLLPSAPLPRPPVAASVLAVPPPETILEPEPLVEVPPLEPRDPTDLVELAEPNEAVLAAEEAPSEPIAAPPADDWTPVAANAVGLGGGPPPRYAGRRPGRRPRGGGAWVPHVELALRWLRDHQDGDGRWDCDGFMKHDVRGDPTDGAGDPLHDVGVTGLALLAFLGEGSTLRDGPYREPLRAGVAWLREQQDPETGRIGGMQSHHFIYDHAIATLALCEAQGLSRYRTLRPAAQAAIDYLQAHRNPYGVWRYQPRGGDQDVSVTGWACLALASAREFGLQVDGRSFVLISSFLDELTDAQGRTGYLERGGPAARRGADHARRFPSDRNESTSAVALLCRVFLAKGEQAHGSLLRQAGLVAAKPPRWLADATGSSVDFYAWYHATYALYQIGEPHWNAWSQALGRVVLDRQRRDGNFAGSWDPVDAWGEDGGRVYATAILALTLQAHYRYARGLGGR